MSRMLKKTLDSLLTPKEYDELISAFDQIGNIIIVRIPDLLLPKKKLIGETLLEQVKNAQSVFYQSSSVEGEFRTRDLEILAGDDKTEFQEECNKWYTQWAKEAEAVIMCHYAAENPRYPTEFWKEGQRKGQQSLLNCNRWNSYAKAGKDYEHGKIPPDQLYGMTFGGGWNPFSVIQNID